jgi:prepilin-type N-terminal cleavage/methylation domain-containing protein
MHTDMSRMRIGILKETKGFTLVELLVGVVISAIVITATMKIYTHMQNSNLQQVEISLLQQNQRGALAIMDRELRLIGMNREQKNITDIGVTDVRRYTITEPGNPAIPDATMDGSPILRVTMALNNDGAIGAGETITYALYDKEGDGAPYELCRSTTVAANSISGRQMLAEGIEAIGLAYAFDWDNGTPDGKIDRVVVNPGDPPSIVWAYDSDNDGLLDAEPGGVPLGYTVPPEQIRAVELWILGSTQRPDPTYLNKNQYAMGYTTWKTPAAGDHFHRWLLREIIHCRNK